MRKKEEDMIKLLHLYTISTPYFTKSIKFGFGQLGPNTFLIFLEKCISF